MIIQTNELVTQAYAGLAELIKDKSIDRAFSYGAPPMLSCRGDFTACAAKRGIVLPEVVSGSDLFTRVINDPAYQVNQRETALLKTAGMYGFFNKIVSVVEFGPGDGIKSNVLLSRLPKLKSYVGIDWSKSNLEAANGALKMILPNTEKKLLLEDNFLDLDWVDRTRRFIGGKGAVLFTALGNTLANYDAEQVRCFLTETMKVFAENSNRKMLLGFDCRIDDGGLNKAYGNDITALFFLNSLRYLNKLLDTDLKIENFDYDIEITRELYGKNVKMYLIPRVDQSTQAVWGGRARLINLQKGQRILVGDSRKFSQDSVIDFVGSAGLKLAPKPGILNDGGICLFPLVRKGPA